MFSEYAGLVILSTSKAKQFTTSDSAVNSRSTIPAN
jgi:hypothetical protein